MNPVSFTIEAEHARARAGILHTPHGDISTPAFVPVGTKGTVKGVLPKTLKETGTDILIANTYHLFLEPGDDVVKQAGGLHTFMGWDGPLMTDSGGFQVFSLGAGFNAQVSKMGSHTEGGGRAPLVFDEDILTQHGKLAIVDDEGVTFTSHIDGSLHRFTPERSVEIQHNLGADIFFAFDECTSPTAEYEYQKEAMYRTHRWAQRSLDAHRRNLEAGKKQGIYGIVQGGRHLDLRKESAETIGSMNFDGIGIGGSFSKEDLGEALAVQMEVLPKEKPVHLLGIGEPGDILEGVSYGIDTFDCVSPTRLGRTGAMFTKRGIINITKSEYKNDFSPLDEDSSYELSRTYTKAYVHHLFRSKEMLGAMILSTHNLTFMHDFARDIRTSILEGKFETFKKDFLDTYSS